MEHTINRPIAGLETVLVVHGLVLSEQYDDGDMVVVRGAATAASTSVAKQGEKRDQKNEGRLRLAALLVSFSHYPIQSCLRPTGERSHRPSRSFPVDDEEVETLASDAAGLLWGGWWIARVHDC